MKVIFLDHQGVMYLKKHPNPGKLDNFDLKCIETLNQILNDEIEIVVSSDWRYWVTFEEMCQFYISQGIKKPIDYLPKIGTGENLIKERSIEIKTWLEKREVEKWVAIDDLDMKGELDRFVLCLDDGINGLGIKEKVENFLK